MLRRHTRTLSLAALGSAAVLGLTLVGSPPAGAGKNHGGGTGTSTVIATGLDNPRQLSFNRSGDLYVAESGEGGAGPCLPDPEDPEAEICFGTSGAITKISSSGRQSRVVTGLASLAGSDGGSATGPADVAAVGKSLVISVGLGGTPTTRSELPAVGRRQMGKLVQTNGRAVWPIADLAAWEERHNPVEDVDSNPVGFVVDRGRYVIADAGGNTVLSVSPWGSIRKVAEFDAQTGEFPPGSGNSVSIQAVPTSVATRGHDGALYVSQLTGGPFPPGAANIYRVDPRTGRTTVYASGLTNVTDLAFRGRTLYAVQLSDGGLALTGPIGSLVKIRPGSSTHSTIKADLFAPYGVAIKGDHAYVTVGSVAKDAGQVLKIRL